MCTSQRFVSVFCWEAVSQWFFFCAWCLRSNVQYFPENDHLKLVVLTNDQFDWCYRPSSRFPQHRRKKRKEMDDGLSESNQHKQSKCLTEYSQCIRRIGRFCVLLFPSTLQDPFSCCFHCPLPHLPPATNPASLTLLNPPSPLPHVLSSLRCLHHQAVWPQCGSGPVQHQHPSLSYLPGLDEE